ncbi:MAG: transposase [Endomicrobium sp.]|nr:transposase [Endomicrobium sp.]
MKGLKQVKQRIKALEFYKGFGLKAALQYFWNYLRSPNSNAFIESFNGTFRKQFLQQYRGDFHDTKNLNKELVNYLLWYNSEKPHSSLNFDTPLNYAINSLNLKS